MGYLVRVYYSISPTSYYKDDACWSADLKSKTTEDIISIGSFVEEQSQAHNTNECNIGQQETRSEDPFNIYDLFNRKQENIIGDTNSNNTMKYPPGFTPLNTPDDHLSEFTTKEKGGEERSQNVQEGKEDSETCKSHPNDNLKEDIAESICSGHFKIPELLRTDGFVLQVMKGLVKIGQIMGYNMEGCLKNIEEIIGSQGAILPLVIRWYPLRVGGDPEEDIAESICSGHFRIPELPRTDGFVLQVMKGLVKIGQIMGYNMEGCLKNIEEIIGSQRASIAMGTSWQLSHLFYADDADFMNIEIIVKVFECFYRASRLRINMNKSKLIGISVANNVVDQAANNIGCTTLTAPFSYLGSKVGDFMSRTRLGMTF
nr:RNA-directed DNA polymerase, eukaryota, reverse transcriptase zinc-binding domain protein [Tanacetum cinerariifolium]